MSYKTQRKFIIGLFLIVPLAFLVTFTFIPAANMLYYSFTDWDGFNKVKHWVGLSNYVELFKNPSYFKALTNSIYYFFGGIVQMVLAFYFAVIVNSKLRGKSLFKSLLFFPYLINSVAISLIFVFFFQPEGTLDSVLKFIGLGAHTQLWLGNAKLINFSLAGVSIWRYMGYNFVLFLGALQSVSSEVLEASVIDGASEWQSVKYIYLPSIRKIMEINIILTISGAISVFEIPYIMTGGANGSNTFVIQTVNTAFQFQKVGLGSAMAIVVLLIVAGTTLVQQKFFKEEA